MKKLMKMILCGLLLCGCTPHNEEPENKEPIEIVSNEKYKDPVNPNDAYALAFNQLSADLKAEDMEKVAEDVALCFVYDFFTFKNKKDSSDIGGLSYLPQNRVDEFAEFAENNFYKNFNSIVSEYGKENLPEVSKVTIESKSETSVDYLEYTYDGYEFKIVVEYAPTKYPNEELKTNMSLTCLVYDGKAMVISLK